MGTATLTTLTIGAAQTELAAIEREIGPLVEARSRSWAGLLSTHEEDRLRRAEELTWLIQDQ